MPGPANSAGRGTSRDNRPMGSACLSGFLTTEATFLAAFFVEARHAVGVCYSVPISSSR